MLQQGRIAWPRWITFLGGGAFLLAIAAIALPAVAGDPAETPVEPGPAAIADPQPSAEPTPAEPAPTEPTPAEPTPAEPTPAEPTPAEPTPAEPAPAEPTPAEPAPVEPTPAEPTPAEPAPVEPTPVEPTPAEPTPAEPTPAEPTPAEPTPAEPAPAKETPVEPATVEPAVTPAKRGEAATTETVDSPPLRFHEGAPREVTRLRGSRTGNQASAGQTGEPTEQAGMPTDLSGTGQENSLSLEPRLENIHPASFQKVTPGKTRLSELLTAMGRPVALKSVAGGKRLEYQVGPFPKVVFQIADDQVVAVVIHLKDPSPVAQVSQELSLTTLRSVSIPDEQGQSLGVSYPERGLQMLYAKGKSEPRVSHVVLEAISAEPFVLRAANTPRHQLQDRLNDLAVARHLAAGDAEACYQQARILAELECLEDARRVLREAGELRSEPRFRLLNARLLAGEGKYEEALAETRNVLKATDTRPLVKAQAECQLADLLVDSPQNDFQQAIQHHMSAITLATPLLKDPSFETRRAAREILISAHLGSANDVAWGNWRNKVEAVGRWLESAQKHVTAYAKQQPDDPVLRLLVLRETLSACAGTAGAIDPAEAVSEVLVVGNRALEQTTAPQVEQHLRRQLGKCLIDAVQIAHVRRDFRQAAQWGTIAASYLEPLEQSRPLDWSEHELIGRLYFLIGFGHVLGKSEHEAAVVWYERALPHLQFPLPENVPPNVAHQGQQYVTMAVSYWEAGAHDEALTLTERGVKLLELAVEQGSLPRQTLAVPYGNLASMHQELGNSQQASAMTARAQQAQAKETTRR